MKILYLIDERGLTGGAHLATELLLKALHSKGIVVDVAEAIRRNSFWGICQRAFMRIFPQKRMPLVLEDPLFLIWVKSLRYDTVCVMSECSRLSRLVSTLPRRIRKVQMIHTNYRLWTKFYPRDKKQDLAIYEKMDCIACVGKIGAAEFKAEFPSLGEKVVSFHNIIDQTNLSYHRKKSSSNPIRIISLARINDIQAKDGPRMIRIAKRLKDEGANFVWDNYGGGGKGLLQSQKMVCELGLVDFFRIHPFDPKVRERLSESDLLVLLSHYEGLPNCIYEALLSGVPVLATRVGGIAELIDVHKNGWLVEDQEDEIFSQMYEVLSSPEALMRFNANLSSYRYDNDSVVNEHLELLGRENILIK